MRLALLCTAVLSSPHGGIPAVNRQILRQLDRLAEARGLPLRIDAWVLHDPPLRPGDAARAIGLSPERLTFRGFAGSKAALLARAATRTTRDHDVILATHLSLSPVARLLSAPKTRVAQFLHGVECWRELSAKNRWGLRRTDSFISNSAFTHRRFLHFNPRYSPIPSRVCWLGAPEDHFPQDAPGEDDAGGALSVLIVGRIVGAERYKGHEQLLAIWPEIRRRVPSARLDIVGDGSGASALRAGAERRGLLRSGAVTLWGQATDDELRDHYRRCAVFAMPSRGEGFGLVYLEAMAFAKPCIASLDDAASEIVLDEETGLLVRYSDREGLFHAFCRLLESPALRAKLGAAGRGRVHRYFLERHFGDRLWTALDLGGRPGTGAAKEAV